MLVDLILQQDRDQLEKSRLILQLAELQGVARSIVRNRLAEIERNMGNRENLIGYLERVADG